jgi:hypothetical protein
MIIYPAFSATEAKLSPLRNARAAMKRRLIAASDLLEEPEEENNEDDKDRCDRDWRENGEQHSADRKHVLK